MGKRGAPRGTVQVPWTEEEWAIIADGLDNGNKGTRGKDLEPRLPGRCRKSIHNALNALRRRRAMVCMACCKTPVKTAGSRCQPCRDKANQHQRHLVRTGRCANCGRPLGEGSSATRCSVCREKRKKYAPAIAKNFRERVKNLPSKNKDPRLKCQRILPWPACGLGKWASVLAAKTKRPVVDAFGGSGEPLRLVHAFDGHVAGYNDMHPGLVAIARCAKRGLETKVGQAYKEMNQLDDFLSLDQTDWTKEPIARHAAYTILKARWIQKFKRSTSKFRPGKLKHLGAALRSKDATITNFDGIQLIQDHHGYQPENAIFLIDPPWPGNDKQFEFKLEQNQWPKLLNALLDLPYEQDYIIMLGAERLALQLLAKHMPHAPCFWRASGSLYAKSIVSLSPRLARSNPSEGIGMPIDFKKFGLA